MKKILLTTTLFVVSVTSYLPAAAQKETKKEEKKHERFKVRHFSDSAFKKDFNTSDTSAAVVIGRIEDINNSLNDFGDVLSSGFDSSDINENLPSYEKSLKFLKFSLQNSGDNLNLNRLNLFRSRLDDICDDMKDWQTSLLDFYTELVGMNTQMKEMFIDSSFQRLPSDSTLRILYVRKIKSIRSKWRITDSAIRKDIVKIDLLQNNVSNDYIDAVEVQKDVKALIKSYELKAFDKESNYLWEKPIADTSSLPLGGILQRSFKVSNRILTQYVSSNTEYEFINLAIFILFFLWVFLNIRKLKQTHPESLSKLIFLKPVPVTAALVIMLVIAPFLDLEHPPAIYIDFLQVLLVIPLSILLTKKWPRKILVYWWPLVGLLVFYAIRNTLVHTTYLARILAFALDIFSIVIGFLFIKHIKENKSLFPNYFGSVIILYMLLNLIAAGCDLFGRVTLSQMFGSTAISNFIQVIGLIVFIEIFLEALFLQLERDKKSTRFTAYLNYENIERRVRNFLIFVAAIFWFINLTQNLDIFDLAYDKISSALTTPHSIGSSSFTLGSIVTFFIVVWVANLCQKYIGYFFGDSGDDSMPEKKSPFGTSILLVRLLILTAGFFVGILASGIPLDKVTIIIGALGVGIGLGLQSIVNNLVSGVILAIERPIQVGDFIEVSSVSGRVKEIGIRSSRISTQDGAEVIIPNGDMLSQKLTNWTLNNSHLRVEMNIKLLDIANLDKTKQLILNILSNNEDIMQTPVPQILISNISQAGADFRILFWAFDINKWVQLKSDTLQKVYEECNKENINIA
jgi:potassium efflux system protein